MDCEVRIDKAKHNDHYPIYGTLKTNMKLGKKQQERHCKPKKCWKPDEERMKEDNRRIFEVLWSKEEQRRKEMEDSKKEEGRKEGRKGRKEPAENLAAPSMPDMMREQKEYRQQ